MAARRKLRQAERRLVDDAAQRALEAAAPAVRELQRVLADDLVPSVPPELSGAAVLAFLDRLGGEIWWHGELAVLVREEGAG